MERNTGAESDAGPTRAEVVGARDVLFACSPGWSNRDVGHFHDRSHDVPFCFDRHILPASYEWGQMLGVARLMLL